jgi:hypothetical protein
MKKSDNKEYIRNNDIVVTLGTMEEPYKMDYSIDITKIRYYNLSTINEVKTDYGVFDARE